ncbi:MULTISPECIES: hypothetical protein [unclassified Streptomyces]|nr:MULTISPECIES: hypothetical protein [unclassified Streptomyces]MYX38421.1 hypothetical protein [Streptomyces sp. SID8377]
MNGVRPGAQRPGTADYAREVVGRGLEIAAWRFGGRPAVVFQLYPR